MHNRHCRQCGAHVPDKYNYCQQCGYSIRNDGSYDPNRPQPQGLMARIRRWFQDLMR